MHEFFSLHPLIVPFYLILMGFLAGFIDAIAGGGGLISLPAIIATGMPISLALGTNKLQSSIGTSVAVYKYYRNGLINFKTVYRGILMGLIGALCGAYLANRLSHHLLDYLVPILMLGIFLFNIFNKHMGVHAGKKRMSEAWFFSLFGFAISFYDAFFGPGTGNFWVMAIVFFLGYTFLEASGYAKMLNLKSNLFSLAVFAYYGQVDYTFGLQMAIGQMVGGYVGAHAVILKGSKLVRPFFIVIVGLNLLMMVYTLFFK